MARSQGARNYATKVLQSIYDTQISNDAIESEITITNVFARTFACKKRIILNRGGAGSSKSKSMSQLITYKMLYERNKAILILRKSLPSFKISTMPMIYKTWEEFGVRDRFREEKNMLNYYYESNWCHFGSIDDVEKVRCFAEGTELLTSTGFKLTQDIKVGELVATMNPKTREMEFRPVTKAWSYSFDGDMIVAGTENNTRGSRRLRFCVTPSHKMLSRKRFGKNLNFKEAGDMLGNDLYENYLPITAKYNKGNDLDFFEIPKEVNINYKKNGRQPVKFPIIPWLKFLGWYLSEGSVCKGRVCISQTRKDMRLAIEKDLSELGIHITIDKESFYINSKDLVRYLQQFGKSGDKFIPREVLDLKPSLLRHLFGTLLKGDGFIRTKTNFTYTTISKQLADDVNELAIKLGYSVFIRKPQLTANRDKYFYTISIKKGGDANLCKAETQKYSGKIYCVEVQPHHTLLSRYEGCSLWTGNSSEWNYIWIEEATELKLNDFKVIRTRLRAPTKDGNPNQLFLSFNPIDERHWIKKDVLDKLDPSIIEEIHSTYRDNPFLPQEAIDDLEDTRNQDRNFWRYMALGEWGRLENLVYSNWDTCSSIPSDAKIVYGVDFGFNAPSVLLKVGYIDNDVWEEELIYESGLTNPEFIAKCKKEIPPSLRNSPIYCDTAEPDRIKEMTQSGLNAKYADKKINEGIDFVKRLKVHIVDSSTNTIKEKSAYVYQTDKEGHPIDKPVEYGDHAMSAERYALYTHLKRGSQYKIRWLS